jgi:hypothetical protein
MELVIWISFLISFSIRAMNYEHAQCVDFLRQGVALFFQALGIFLRCVPQYHMIPQ